MASGPAQILIIDDDASFRRVLELRLRSFMKDMQTTYFETIQGARDYLRSQAKLEFDLVILDEHLPDGRGMELLSEGWFENLAVLMISSDTAPGIPGASLQAGAMYFLNKIQVREELFRPLITGIIDRNKLQRELNQARIKAVMVDTVKTLVATLRHEINNPLGAVLGAAYIMRQSGATSPEQVEAAELVESSGKRIKHVLDELCKAIEIEPVTKAHQRVFHIPGDERWDDSKKKPE